MTAIVDGCTKMLDLTEQVNLVESEAKQEVKKLLRKFDFESTTDKSKVKHYPINVSCKLDNEEPQIALDNISICCWNTLLRELKSVAFSNRFKSPLKSYEFGDSPEFKNVKLGKIYMCSPNRFSHAGKEVEEVKIFAFGHEDQGKYEVMGEINFAVEIY